MTTSEGGALEIRPDGALLTRVSDARFEQITQALDDYLGTLPLQWRRVIGGYRLVDCAHKVVGVGSVGLRAFIALLEGSAPDDLLFLQLKQAQRSVLARFTHGSHAWHHHQGQRVVEYQQALQTVSDPLLGWATLPAFAEPSTATYLGPFTEMPGSPALQVYVRQYRNMKGAVIIDGLGAEAVADYAVVSGCCWPRAMPAPPVPRESRAISAIRTPPRRHSQTSPGHTPIRPRQITQPCCARCRRAGCPSTSRPTRSSPGVKQSQREAAPAASSYDQKQPRRRASLLGSHHDFFSCAGGQFQGWHDHHV